ncbi:hypothetical protein Ais01nite_74080 [Asanoa ishikariensis]|uniref:BNR/Asp-box repeat-containing protein n=1 Tax=Asanoa ishikariensis TaxID=137265 RepID=A0A1H3US03_9ACTN|nr:sialidase family protein [Asanoa ishikariensis]GIF69373.1 hypothetical protein Ais01nite_74080 [Asanoa ishikariensis]SDZ65118.1 hypothetical protein SAMN05421684_7932 [Asanoa ishikariensis]
MSDVNDYYDRTAVAARVTAPPFAELVDRSQHRARRARKARLAGVAVLSLLTAGPLLALPGGSAPNTPVAAPSPSVRAWSSFDIMIEFYDTHFGVAQYPGESCGEGWLSVTQDGGKTWSELRAHPKIPDLSARTATPGEPACMRPAAMLTAPDTLVMAATMRQSQLAGGPAYISHDRGRNWREYQPQVRVADSVPAGVIPRWRCDEQRCKEEGLGWYDPVTGDWMVLKNQPPGANYISVTGAFDDSIWVDGSGPDGSGQFQLAVSHDRGRTWLDRTPKEDIDWLARAGSLTAFDGSTAYLYPMMDTTQPDPFSLYRTTDGGKTWLPAPAAQEFKDVVFVWTNRQGALNIADLTHHQHLSMDGGNTFADITSPVWGATHITGGLQGWPIDVAAADPVDMYLSDDGVTWQPVEIPYYQRS